MADDDVNSCNTRMVTAPDGRDIPVPSGGLGLSGGSDAGGIHSFFVA
jgi:hypothetical protein